MKKIMIPLITIICLACSATALASGYRYKGYSGGYGHGGHGYGHSYGKSYGKHYGHSYRGYYGHRGYRRHGYGHSSHHSDEGAYLLGGLLIGAVLTDSYHRAQYKRAYPPERQVIYRTRIVESRAEPTAEIAAPGRHLFRDIEGNCFEIRRNDAGDELRSALPAEECDW